MNAGNIRFKLTWSSLWHLFHGGTRLKFAPGISILRVVLLLDVSKWQGAINFMTMLLGGAQGVITKCGQGVLADLRFSENWTKAKEAGLPRGSYWFYDSRVDPKVQAAFWWGSIRYDRGELMHFADYEENYGGPWGGHRHFKVFLQEFQRLSNFPSSKIGIYTGFYYWIAHSPTTLADLNWFAQFPLWLAWYTTNPANVVIPKPWTSLILWQYGTPVNGQKYGVESLEIDESNFNGDEKAYQERFGLGGSVVLPPITPIGGTMKGTVTKVVTSSLNVRSAATGQVVATLKYDFTLGRGDAVYGEVKADNRIYFTKIYRANGNTQALTELCSAITKEGSTIWMLLSDEPEPGTPPSPVDFRWPPRFEAQYLDAAGNVVANKFYTPE